MSLSRDSTRSGASFLAGTPSTLTSRLEVLRGQIAALELDGALDLTEEQASALLPSVEEARSQLRALEERRAAAEPALAAALLSAVDDLTRYGAISEATREAVRAAQGGFPGALRRGLEALWRRAREVLSHEQLQRLDPPELGTASSAVAVEPRWSRIGRGARLWTTRPGRTLLSDPFLLLLRWRAGFVAEPRARA